MKKFFILTLTIWLLCFAVLPANATLTAHLDRNQIIEGEIVQLTIEATGRISESPNTKPLSQDFDVMAMMSGYRMNIINGSMESRTTWTISLTPKHSGELIVPSLTINGEQTPQLTLQVNEISAGSATDATPPVLLETEIDKNDPYVQGMVRYTLRVLFTVNLAQGSLTDPEPENALVHRVGEDREYQTTRNGQTYQVIERRFVVFPQQSGTLFIPAPVLDAQIPGDTSRDPYFNRMFTSSRPIRLRGEAFTLEVKPRPDQSKSQFWLPAEAVELTEVWQPQDNTLAVGDPLTRNITITVLGVVGEQLPELQFEDIDGIKLYPDRPQTNTHNLQNNIQGEKSLRIAYMPTQTGSYTLPELMLHWWDTKSDQERVATLPARIVEVVAASNQQNTMQPPEVTTQPFLGREEGNHTYPVEQLNNEVASWSKQTNWFWISVVFATLWLYTLGLWWSRQRSSSPGSKIEPYSESVTSRRARKQFFSACKNNNAQQARYYLLKWATSHWSETPPKGLEELALRLNDAAINAELSMLDRILYQDSDGGWQGRELLKLLTKFPKLDREFDKQCDLPNLYS